MDQVKLSKHVVDVEQCGHVDVFVQGDLESGKNCDSILMTIHGVGQSHRDWVQFMSHEDMADTVARSLVLHVCLPGQDLEAEDLPGSFPSLAALGMNLVNVLDQLRVSRVVLVGAGAGANIAARFAMNHPGRVQGMLLVDCKHAVASFPLKLKVLRNTKWSEEVNAKNVASYEESYKNRNEILSDLSQRVTVDTLLLCGAKSQLVRAAEEMHANIAAGLCSIIKLDDVMDVVVEAPERLADSLILFCQGLGLVPSVQRKISRSQSVVSEASSEDQGEARPSKPRKVSMEMFDIPNIRRLSLTCHNI